MESPMDMSVLLRFLVRTLGVFALIFVLALLTPKIAKIVDQWLEKYRSRHDPKQDETYGIRSIYELPPKEEAAPAKDETPDLPDAPELPDEPEEAETAYAAQTAAELTEEPAEPESPSTPEEPPAAEEIVPWFMR